MRRFCLSLVATAFAALPAFADTVSEGPDRIGVTLYHSEDLPTEELAQSRNPTWMRSTGLAFITEERTIDIPAGPSIIRFRGVASTMVPQSAAVQGLPGDIAERNFDYDLLSPGSLLAKSVGETVHLVRTNPKTGARTDTAAIVRTGPNGAMLEIDGKLEALRCSALPEKLVFDSVPAGLTDTPTLSLRTVAPVAGRYTVKLSYIATALNWNADYVARIAPDGKTLDLSGWITLANFGETSFPHVPVDVVAGRLNVTGDDEPADPEAAKLATACWPTNIDWARHLRGEAVQTVPMGVTVFNREKGGAETIVVTAEKREIVPRKLGDYKLYPLPEPTTLAAQQTKQVQFLDQQSIPFEKLYTDTLSGTSFDEAQSDIVAATVTLHVENTRATGLGKPLPGGAVSVQAPDADGDPVLLGQSGILDTPENLPVEIAAGHAMDVEIVRRVAKSETTGDGDKRRVRTTIDIAISNGKPEPVAFEFSHGLYDDWAHIVSESVPHTMKKNMPTWRFAIPAHDHVTLEYTIEVAEQ
ncbi:MAG TPA: hypothetical protein VGG10_11595 [Rhizomicrobium sp.]|jgi:hypothetical protein